MTDYTWFVSGGGTITAGGGTTDDFVTITWTSGSRSVGINYQNSFGCWGNGATGLPVFVNPIPTPVISGPVAACANSTGHVYSTPTVGGNTYVWAISGGTITAGAGTNSITVTWNAAGAGWVTVTETIPATTCSITTAQYNVTINPLPAPVISGPVAACANSTGNAYSTPNVGGHTYVWAISGGSITAGAGTNSITVTWNAAGAGWVQVTETITATTCAATTAQYNVTINPLPAPVISGPVAACANSTGHVYSTPLVAGHTYVWAISGGTITAVQEPIP